MILNHRKLCEKEHFPKIIDANIDIFDYKDKLYHYENSREKIKKNQLNNLKSDSLKEIESNEDCKKVSILEENKKIGKEKRKIKKRGQNQEQISSLESDCSEFEKLGDLKKNRLSNRNHLFTALSIDAKLASNTSYFNLKSPINYNLKKTDAFKLPRLVEHVGNQVPFNINRVIQKNRQTYELSNLSKHTLDEESFSLPIITNKKKFQVSNHLCLKSEKVYLVDKNKLINEDLVDFELNKNGLMENFSDNQFSKKSLDFFLRNKNRKKENFQELIKHKELGKKSKVIQEKHRFSPSAKYSQVDEKMYLEIFIPAID